MFLNLLMLERMQSMRSFKPFSSNVWSKCSVFSLLNAILMRVRKRRFICGSVSKFVLSFSIRTCSGVNLCFFVKM